MGSIRGQELGLGSGIVNMARQVGFAIGVALFVAVFTGAIDDRTAEARQEVAALEQSAALSPAEQEQLAKTAFADPDDPFAERPAPQTPPRRRRGDIVNEEVRDAYGAAFRVGRDRDPPGIAVRADDAAQAGRRAASPRPPRPRPAAA